MSATRITTTGANGVTLVADSYGRPSDPPVLLLHGGGQTRHSWGGTAAALAADGWYAVSADLRGHGDSDWCPNGDYSFEAFRIDTEAWCERLGHPVVVGASMGGIAALWTEGHRSRAGLAPACRALVLVDIAPRTEDDGIARIVAFMQARPEGFASLDEAAELVAEYLPHRPRRPDPSGLARNLRLGEDGRYRWHWDPAFLDPARRPRAHTQVDQLRDCARRLTMPTLLVRGRMSDVVSEAGARDFLELVPHAEYVDVADAAHMVAGDRNDAFTTAVADFLRRHLARGVAT